MLPSAPTSCNKSINITGPAPDRWPGLLCLHLLPDWATAACSMKSWWFGGAKIGNMHIHQQYLRCSSFFSFLGYVRCIWGLLVMSLKLSGLDQPLRQVEWCGRYSHSPRIIGSLVPIWLKFDLQGLLCLCQENTEYILDMNTNEYQKCVLKHIKTICSSCSIFCSTWYV